MLTDRKCRAITEQSSEDRETKTDEAEVKSK